MSFPHRRKCPPSQEAAKFEIEMLEQEILNLKGKSREEALKAYRRLLKESDDKPIYLIRSDE